MRASLSVFLPILAFLAFLSFNNNYFTTKTIVVQKGESLSILAERYYGDTTYYGIIKTYNRIFDENKIYADQVLVIPNPYRVPVIYNPPKGTGTYRVKDDYDVSEFNFKKWNNISGEKVLLGEDYVRKWRSSLYSYRYIRPESVEFTGRFLASLFLNIIWYVIILGLAIALTFILWGLNELFFHLDVEYTKIHSTIRDTVYANILSYALYIFQEVTKITDFDFGLLLLLSSCLLTFRYYFLIPKSNNAQDNNGYDKYFVDN